MWIDKLKLNEDKTEFIIICTSVQLSKLNVSDIIVGQARISSVTAVKDLGSDANLNISVHIGHLSSHNVRRIRKYLTFDDRKSIVQSVIMSRIDYCNCHYSSSPCL